MLLEIGQVLDAKYRIVRLIGEGGMGAVFEGENLRVRRRVAIKVLHPDIAGNDETVQRFEREAQAAGRIGSDHILEVIDLGVMPNGQRFMVMEYLEGEPLSARIARSGRLAPEQIVPLVLQVLKGLAAAHEAGIIHRDLKPDNIFILREKANVPDFVKLIDFGISKVALASAQTARLTRTGAVMGTPYYLSPEQANGSRDVDARSDIYSIGVILYEAITGKIPFDARSFNELLFKIVLAEPMHPQHIVPEVDPNFCAIVMKAMARDPALRFGSCAELGNALQSWMYGRAAGAQAQAPFGAGERRSGSATSVVSPMPPMAAMPQGWGVPSSPWGGGQPVSAPFFGPPAEAAPSSDPLSIPGVRSSRRMLLFGSLGAALGIAVIVGVALTRGGAAPGDAESSEGEVAAASAGLAAASASVSAGLAAASASAASAGLAAASASAASASAPSVVSGERNPGDPSVHSADPVQVAAPTQAPASSSPSPSLVAMPVQAAIASPALTAAVPERVSPPLPLSPAAVPVRAAARVPPNNSPVGSPFRPKNSFSWGRPQDTRAVSGRASSGSESTAKSQGVVGNSEIDMGY